MAPSVMLLHVQRRVSSLHLNGEMRFSFYGSRERGGEANRIILFVSGIPNDLVVGIE